MRLPRLFGRRDPAPGVTPDSTPIHAWLDAAGFPWRETRGDLAARFGVTQDPAYHWQVISVPTDRPLLDGLIRPLYALAMGGESEVVPTLEFFGSVWFGDDARDNIRRAADQLRPVLGRTRIEPEGNTLKAAWRFGPASLSLTVWPPELQSAGLRNDAHQRDPRLVTACHVYVVTGYRPPLSEREQSWLETLSPLTDPLPRPPNARAMRDTRPTAHHLEFTRQPPADLSGVTSALGRSADGEGLVICTSQLFVVPMADVLSVRLERVRPARGGGGEWLCLSCRSGDQAKDLGVEQGSYQHGLEAFGRELAARLDRPFELVDGGEDV